MAASWRRSCAALLAAAAASLAAATGAPAGVAAAAAGSGVTGVKRILHFSDVHMNISRESGDREPDVVYSFDATPALLRSALAYARQVVPDPEIFLYTGDSVAHFAKDPAFAARAMRTTAEIIESYFPSTMKPGRLHVSSVVGNADTSPGYTMEATDPEWEANPSLTRFANVWPSAELSAADRELLSRRGYLAYELDEKLAVLSLNTLPYSPRVTESPAMNRDPFGQLKWLNETLRELQRDGKVAYIVGHIPPIIAPHTDQPVWHPEYIEAYMQVVAENARVVKAQLFGHIHSVELRAGPLSQIHRENQQLRTGTEDARLADLPPVFTGAAISPLFGNNPGFISWEIDPSTYDLLDFVVYGANVSASADETDWKPLYRASEAYGVRSLSATELKSFAARAKSDARLLERYYFFSRVLSYRQSPCASDAVCRSRWYCSMQWLPRAEEHLACMAHEQLTAVAADEPAVASKLPWRQPYSKIVDMSDLAECLAAVWILGALLLIRVVMKRRETRTKTDVSSNWCSM